MTVKYVRSTAENREIDVLFGWSQTTKLKHNPAGFYIDAKSSGWHSTYNRAITENKIAPSGTGRRLRSVSPDRKSTESLIA